MRKFVYADACPIVSKVETVAKWHSVPTALFCYTNQVLCSDYSRIKGFDLGADAVDFALINLIRTVDVVVTLDFGAAA